MSTCGILFAMRDDGDGRDDVVLSKSR